jgi:hypothetical protein
MIQAAKIIGTKTSQFIRRIIDVKDNMMHYLLRIHFRFNLSVVILLILLLLRVLPFILGLFAEYHVEIMWNFMTRLNDGDVYSLLMENNNSSGQGGGNFSGLSSGSGGGNGPGGGGPGGNPNDPGLLTLMRELDDGENSKNLEKILKHPSYDAWKNKNLHTEEYDKIAYHPDFTSVMLDSQGCPGSEERAKLRAWGTSFEIFWNAQEHLEKKHDEAIAASRTVRPTLQEIGFSNRYSKIIANATKYVEWEHGWSRDPILDSDNPENAKVNVYIRFGMKRFADLTKGNTKSFF